jgi:hypothetical protein
LHLAWALVFLALFMIRMANLQHALALNLVPPSLS